MENPSFKEDEEKKENPNVEKTLQEDITLQEDNLGFDYIFLRLPHLSLYQILLFSMAQYCWVVAGLVQVGSVIIQASPAHRCKTQLDSDLYNISFEEGLSFTPKDECKMYAIDWPTACPNALTIDELNDCFTANNLAESAEIECENGYESVFDQSLFTNTVVTEYQLVCSNAWIETVISTLFMAGLFFGVSIFGPIMDKFGRLNAMMISSIGLCAVQIPLIFIPVSATIWTFAAFRFLSGTFSIAVGTASFVYGMEIIGIKYRTIAGVTTQSFFSVGYMLLSLVGYLLSDWRDQMIVITCSPLIYICIFHWLLPTSTAWLYSSNRNDLARKSIQALSKHFPEAELTDDFIDEIEFSVKQKTGEMTDVTYSQADLFKTPNMRRVTILEMYQWFATTLVYYGLSFGAGNLAGSVLMNNFYNGLLEFICYLILPYLMDWKRVGRKYGTVITMGIGAIGCLCAGIFGELSEGPDDTYADIKKYGAYVGKFGVAGTFGIVYVHASELYPTPIRGIGVGLASAGGRVGGLLAPLINALGNQTTWLPYIIFGVLGIIQVITVFWIPETLGVPMLTTLEEAEEFYKNVNSKDAVDMKHEDEKTNVSVSDL